MRLKSRLLPTLLIAIVGLSYYAEGSELSLNAGVGYDLLSQEYFLDSATAAGTDSIIVNWQLTTYYLDDFKGQLGLRYRPWNDHRLELRGRFDQTADFVRLKLGGNAAADWSTRRIQCSGEFEIKDRYHGEAEFGDSYVRAFGRGKLYQPLTSSLELGLQLKTDGVRFASSSDYSYNYYRVGGDIGLQKSFEGGSFGDLRLIVDHRRVPDSLELDYLSVGAEAALLAFYSHGEIDILADVTKRDYRQIDHKDDYSRFDLEIDHRLHLGRGWFSRQQVETELTRFNPDDPVNVDYSRFRLIWLAGLEQGLLSLAGGPAYERLDESESDFTIAEDYSEIGLRINLDYLKPSRLFGSVESTFGRRDLKSESDLQTDFTFERLSLISDASITEALRLSLLFSAEWEWHNQSQENSRMYLLSSSLTYEF